MKVCRLSLLLTLLALCGTPAASDRMSPASDTGMCKSALLRERFHQSRLEAGTEQHNASVAEEVAGANEDAFLACPKQFMRELSGEDAETQQAVAHYFGLFEVERVASELSALQTDPEVGELVRERFARYLHAQRP